MSEALALACILCPVAVDGPLCRLETMQAVAVSLEIMDEREQRFMFSREEDFTCDLKLVQRRYTELRDAPPACDAIRFPDREAAREAIDYSRFYVSWLKERKTVFHDSWIDDAIADAEYIQHLYDLVTDAQCEYYYVTVRRAALRDLRKELGPHAYYAGVLPPVLPVWPLWRID